MPDIFAGTWLVPALVVVGIVIFFMFLVIVSRIKRCPSDQILVKYGKVGGGSAKCIHGGAAFIWPVIQSYEYMSLTPIQIDVSRKAGRKKTSGSGTR